MSDANDTMRQKEAIVVATGESLFTKTASLMQDWADGLNVYVAGSTEVEDATVDLPEGALRLMATYCDLVPRLNDFVVSYLTQASEWLGPTDEPRISVWPFDERGKVLRFGWCTQNVGEALAAARFEINEGITGVAFAERVVYNVVDPTHHDNFKHFDGAPYPYKSMLIVPICYGPLTLGVLCVDRMCEAAFASTVVMVMKALASHLGIALALSQARERENNSWTGRD